MVGVMAVGKVLKYDLQRTSAALSEWNIRAFFDQVWDNVIEPRAPD
jgi:hypothetical protein